jgi:hypothetical protein
MEILEGQTTFVGHDVTQLGACEEYCRRQGLERFHEKGESAVHGLQPASEPAHVLSTEQGPRALRRCVQLTRFARDKYDHFALRSLL